MNNPFATLVERCGVVLFDGALSTELERRGANLSSHLWSAHLITQAPQSIVSVHLDYLRAGADVVSTASYQASRLGFSRLGLTETDADALLARAVSLGHEAVLQHGSGLVAASLGPYGAVLADGSEFTGDYSLTVDELVAFHRPRVEAVLQAKPDLVLFETLPSMTECEAVGRLAEEFSQVAFMASFSAKSQSISHGESFSDVVARLDRVPNVLAVGLNCSAPEVIGPHLKSAGPHRVLLAASPNSGETWDAQERRWVGAPKQHVAFAELGQSYFDAGARVLGGCCRTRPSDIVELRNRFPRR